MHGWKFENLLPPRMSLILNRMPPSVQLALTLIALVLGMPPQILRAEPTNNPWPLKIESAHSLDHIFRPFTNTYSVCDLTNGLVRIQYWDNGLKTLSGRIYSRPRTVFVTNQLSGGVSRLLELAEAASKETAEKSFVNNSNKMFRSWGITFSKGGVEEGIRVQGEFSSVDDYVDKIEPLKKLLDLASAALPERLQFRNRENYRAYMPRPESFTEDDIDLPFEIDSETNNTPLAPK